MKIIIEADSKEIAALVSELQERRRWELFESPVIYRGLSEQGVAGVFGCQNTGSKGSLIENHGGGAGKEVNWMGDVHRLKINTRTGVFELDGVSIMEQVLECTIHYRGDAPSVVEMTILADIDLEDCLEIQARSTRAR